MKITEVRFEKVLSGPDYSNERASVVIQLDELDNVFDVQERARAVVEQQLAAQAEKKRRSEDPSAYAFIEQLYEELKELREESRDDREELLYLFGGKITDLCKEIDDWLIPF